MSLGVGASIGVGVDETNLQISKVMFGGNDSVNTANRFITPNARGGGSAAFNASIRMIGSGIIKKFGIKPDTKGNVARDVVISINNVDQEASRLTMPGSTTTYKEVSLNIAFKDGDYIAIHFPAGGNSTDDYMYSMHIEYDGAPMPQQQSFTQEITVTTTFIRSSFTFVGASVTYNGQCNVPCYPGFHKRFFIKVITAPTLGDTITITRRKNNSASMDGTVNKIIDDTASDGDIIELEQNVPFVAGDQLNLGYVRAGAAGVAPKIEGITIWEFTV